MVTRVDLSRARSAAMDCLDAISQGLDKIGEEYWNAQLPISLQSTEARRTLRSYTKGPKGRVLAPPPSESVKGRAMWYAIIPDPTVAQYYEYVDFYYTWHVAYFARLRESARKLASALSTEVRDAPSIACISTDLSPAVMGRREYPSGHDAVAEFTLGILDVPARAARAAEDDVFLRRA